MIELDNDGYEEVFLVVILGVGYTRSSLGLKSVIFFSVPLDILVTNPKKSF